MSVSYETLWAGSGSSYDNHHALDGVTQSLCAGERPRRLFTFEVLHDDPHSGCSMAQHSGRCLSTQPVFVLFFHLPLWAEEFDSLLPMNW